MIVEVFHCFSSFHSNLLIHRVGVALEETKCMVEIMVRCINNLHLLNAEESKEFMQWLSSYIGDNERHPDVYTLLHEVGRFLKNLYCLKCFTHLKATRLTANLFSR